MLDKKGKEIRVGDKVRWPTNSAYNPFNHEGIVITLVPKGTDCPDWLLDNLTDKKYKLTGTLILCGTIDRVFVTVNRPKSCPLLYNPRPTSIEVIG